MVKSNKEAQQIFKAIEPRLIELWKKLIEGKYNKATQTAYWVGFVSDIDYGLKRLMKKIFNDLEKSNNYQKIKKKYLGE